MFEVINIIIVILLCVVQFIYFSFILPNKPIVIKETDTIRKVKKTKKYFENIILVLKLVTVMLFIICMLNKLIIGIYVVVIIIFLVFGVYVIEDRIESKEDILKRIK